MSGRVGKVVLMKNGGWSNPHCNGFGARTLLETTFSFSWNDFFFFLKRLFLHELMFACGARDFIWLQRQKSLRVFLPFRAVSEAVFGSHSWWQHVPTVALSSLIGFLAKASPPRSYSYLGYLTRVFPKLRQTSFPSKHRGLRPAPLGLFERKESVHFFSSAVFRVWHGDDRVDPEKRWKMGIPSARSLPI